VVHPLLVLKAAQDYAATKNEESLKSMKEEMEEGLEQVEKQKAALLK
jgi:predicted DNA-binding transcriptional regulator